MERVKTVFSLSRRLALIGVTGFALAYLVMPVWAADGAIQSIQYDSETRHFIIDATGPVKAMVNTVNIGGHKRVIVDIDNAEIANSLPRDRQLLQNLSARMPGLRNITVNQYGGNGRPVVRVLFEIENDANVIRLIRNQGMRLELEVGETVASSQMPSLRPAVPMSRSAENASIDPGVLQLLESQRRQIAALQQQIGKLQADVKTTDVSDGSMEELRQTVAQLNQKYDALVKENRALKAQVAAPAVGPSSATISSLKSEIERLKASNASLKSELDNALSSMSATQAQKKAVADLQNQLEDSKRKLERLTYEKQQLQAQLNLTRPSGSPSLDELKRTLVTLNQRYDQLLAENKRLKEENANRQVQPRTAGEAGNISATALQNLRQQLTQAQQSLSDSIATINEQNKEIAYLRNQIADVKAGMDASNRAQLSQLRAERDEKAARIRELEQQLAARAGASQTTGSQAEVATLKRQLEQATSQYKGTLDDLTRQLNVKAQQIQERDQQLAEARNASQQRAAQLQAQVDTLRAQLNEATQKAADSQALAGRANQSSAAELQKKNAQISALQTEIAQLKSQQENTAALRAELDALKRAGNSSGQAVSTLKAEIAKLTQENQTLKAQLSQARQSDSQISVLKGEIARLTEENQSLKRASASSETSQLKAELASLQAQVSTLKAQYEKASSDAKKAQQALESQKKVMMATKPATGSGSAALQKQVADLTRQLADLRSENAALRSKAPSQPASANPEAEKNYQEAKAALSAGNMEVALEKFQAAQLLEPDNQRYTIDYSIALAQEHEYAEAADLLRRYLQRNPGDREAYGQLGKIYLLNDQTEMATQALSRAIPVGTLNNYATALKKAGKNEDAENIFKMALKLNPHDSEVLFNLGNLYNATERLELARNSYLQAIQAKPGFAEAHYNLGLIYAKLGDRPKAVTHLEKFLQLSPGARNADTIRAYIEKLKV
jgi:tetratricopeptide (TPR) repeat protein